MHQLFTFGANNDLLRALLAEGVRFLVVGGLAVKFYAPAREVDDLDLLLEQTADNADRLFKAFAALGLLPGFPKETIAASGERPQHLPLKVVYYADLITRPDVEFSDEWNNACEGLVCQNRVRFASRKLLLRLKGGAAREKDLADIALLGSPPTPPST